MILKPNNIAEFFFADDYGRLPQALDMKEVDLIYNNYMKVMSCMHEKLRKMFNSYVELYLDDSQRIEY